MDWNSAESSVQYSFFSRSFFLMRLERHQQDEDIDVSPATLRAREDLAVFTA